MRSFFEDRKSTKRIIFEVILASILITIISLLVAFALGDIKDRGLKNILNEIWEGEDSNPTQ